jgi:hypothetical protein
MQEPQLGSAGRELEEAERGAEVAEALSTAVFIARAYQTQTLVAVHRRALRAGADADADGAVGGYLYDDLGEVQRREHLLDRALQEPALLRGQGGAATDDVVLAALDLDVVLAARNVNDEPLGVFGLSHRTLLGSCAAASPCR